MGGPWGLGLGPLSAVVVLDFRGSNTGYCRPRPCPRRCGRSQSTSLAYLATDMSIIISFGVLLFVLSLPMENSIEGVLPSCCKKHLLRVHDHGVLAFFGAYGLTLWSRWADASTWKVCTVSNEKSLIECL